MAETPRFTLRLATDKKEELSKKAKLLGFNSLAEFFISAAESMGETPSLPLDSSENTIKQKLIKAVGVDQARVLMLKYGNDENLLTRFL